MRNLIGSPRSPGPQRMPTMKTNFKECCGINLMGERRMLFHFIRRNACFSWVLGMRRRAFMTPRNRGDCIWPHSEMIDLYRTVTGRSQKTLTEAEVGDSKTRQELGCTFKRTLRIWMCV
ncbi:hypothetical protein NPIL_696341 [Nephila pilipes]|uniref:Uncharacterized protein n=1 Tax=Nephila pilipes TaxID=299642 RepID=A0A8X6MKM7_NEPPI|nr:hypothetical protein NPIL_696341 [Nephila pilipes]